MLQVQGLGYTYPGASTPALSDVSFAAPAGQVLGLLGPNGAGKSTLMALLAGLLVPAAGAITLDGQPLRQQPGGPAALALAPQQDAFYPMLSVAENLRCFAAAAGLRGALAQERQQRALAQVQLQPHTRRRAGELSGGLKRRLNLAIALLQAPRVLLLDEPTAGVDPQSRAFMLGTLRELAAAGQVLIFSSHLMSEIEALASQVLILDHGRVLRHQPLSTLLADESATLALEAGGIAPALIDALLAAHGRMQRQDERRVQLQVHPGGSAVQALAALEAAGATVHGARFGRSSLEHTFIALTDEALRDG
jgi:ABC-2 type transport system ATP-binding protein